MPLFARVIFLAFSITVPAAAQTGAPFELDWPHSGERLVYGSRGCADECWMADVRDKRGNRLIGRLQCDGKTLSYDQPSVRAKGIVVGTCDDINDSAARGVKSKFEAIPEILERLLARGTRRRT